MTEFCVLSEDYSKIVFMHCDRYIELHSQAGRYYRLRFVFESKIGTLTFLSTESQYLVETWPIIKQVPTSTWWEVEVKCTGSIWSREGI